MFPIRVKNKFQPLLGDLGDLGGGWADFFAFLFLGEAASLSLLIGDLSLALFFLLLFFLGLWSEKQKHFLSFDNHYGFWTIKSIKNGDRWDVWLDLFWQLKSKKFGSTAIKSRLIMEQNPRPKLSSINVNFD